MTCKECGNPLYKLAPCASLRCSKCCKLCREENGGSCPEIERVHEERHVQYVLQDRERLGRSGKYTGLK